MYTHMPFVTNEQFPCSSAIYFKRKMIGEQTILLVIMKHSVADSERTCDAKCSFGIAIVCILIA
jgi:hypothetical protein